MTKKTDESTKVVAKEVVIKNVVVQIGEKEIILTIEEARKLRDVLDNIFGKEVIKETKIIHEHDWNIYRDPYVWPYKYPKVTWDDITYDKHYVGDFPKYEVTCDAKMYNSNGIAKKLPKSETMFLSITG